MSTTEQITDWTRVVTLARQARIDVNTEGPGVRLADIPAELHETVKLLMERDVVHIDVVPGVVGGYIVHGPIMDEGDFDMWHVVDLVRRQGIECHVFQTGGGTQTIYAGPTHLDAEGEERYAVLAGPGSGTTFSEIAVGSFGDFTIGADDNGESDDYTVTDETWTVQRIADAIVDWVHK